MCLVDEPEDNRHIHIGSLGTICRGDDCGRVGVRWDDDVGGNDCRGTCEHGHGWFMDIDKIGLYEEEGTIDIEESSFMSMIGGAR